MLSIKASGQTSLQGASGGWAAPDESPALQIKFSYDFLMDSTEVTQGSFHRLMGRDPVPDSSKFGKGDDYPVYDVSWYDAVLFCNARSREAGLDTVYAYGRLERAPGGTVINLAGLTVNLDKRGFRLPTEAEWEYADRAGTETDFAWGPLADSGKAGDFAWFSSNARGTTHQVASMKANRFGLYDMSGNVMEWVNDWKGPYGTLAETDFSGARDPGVGFDIPVKGGAFKYGLHELRPANRSATYTTIRSATAEYVGFRCALGAIAQPHYSTPDGTRAATDPVELELTRLGSLVGGRPAKLVFVNATQSVRHLAYVDFRVSSPRVREFGDADDVFYPVISPDGNWVAYGSAVEGTPTGSMLSIRRLGDSLTAITRIGSGFIPRWWVDPVSLDTFLIYSNSAVDNSQSQWKSDKTLALKIQGGKPSGEPIELAEGGFHDGRSSNGRWLATGFHYLKVRDGATGLSHTLFSAPGDGKTGTDTSQVCNVSIAPDSTGRTLFLDFGYEGNSTITGSFYDIHQIAFIADAEGRVERWLTAPPGERGWEDLEWTNHPDFAVSGATDNVDGHHHLYLLNLKDSVITRLATGTQLSTPGLWLGEVPAEIPTDGLSLDSLGQYANPAGSVAREVFANKMHVFWRTHAVMEGAFLGSSQMADGLDPAEIKSLRAYNLAYGEGDMKSVDFIARNYVLPHCPKLKLVAFSVPLGWFDLVNFELSWSARIANCKGVQYDQNHDFWRTGVPFGFEELAARVPYNDYSIDSLGLFQFPSSGWGGNSLDDLPAPWDLTSPNYQNNMRVFEQLVADISARKIHCVFLNFPVSPVYKTMISTSAGGPNLATTKAINAQISALQSKYPYFHFIDMNQDGNHDFGESDAFDSMHLSRSGAAKLSARLDAEIAKFPQP
ncbi:MAG: SUMF1/EgtB/PvdO family nonheme iron enzyme [Fibrobacteria bacterium]